MLTYKNSGVDIDTADATKQEIAKHIQTTDARVLNKLGAFASLFKADFPRIKNPVLVFKTEEPGSKQLLAAQHGKLSSIAYDLINHLINDIIVMGATPLAVLDTIICGKIEKDVVSDLVEHMANACRLQNCSLVGGETSEQPGVIREGRYILSAAGIGVVDQSQIIDGSKIQEGDIIIGVESNGLHTNGYSLVRRLLYDIPDLSRNMSFIDAVLKPHLCYYQAVKGIRSIINGMAHITGGGIDGNIKRIMPNGLGAKIKWDKIIDAAPLVFCQIQNEGVPITDMKRTFNMGIGLCLMVKKKHKNLALDYIYSNGYEANIIGEIIK